MDIVPIIEHKSGMGGFLYSNRESSKKKLVSVSEFWIIRKDAIPLPSVYF